MCYLRKRIRRVVVLHAKIRLDSTRFVGNFNVDAKFGVTRALGDGLRTEIYRTRLKLLNPWVGTTANRKHRRHHLVSRNGSTVGSWSSGKNAYLRTRHDAHGVPRLAFCMVVWSKEISTQTTDLQRRIQDVLEGQERRNQHRHVPAKQPTTAVDSDEED